MIIIKTGGGANVNWDYIAADLAQLRHKEQFVIIHGASVKRDEIAEKLSAPTKTVISPSGISSVYTDEKALEIFLMVYAGLTNKKIVAKLQQYGIDAVGLSGVDGRLWEAKRKSDLLIRENGKTKLIKDNQTGRVEKTNTKLIKLLVDHGYVPVLCPPAISNENEIVNVDNDWATAILAGALGVKQIVVLFEAPGMLKNHTDEKSLIKTIARNELDSMMQFAQGRMKKKILGAKKALELGVEKIFWGDGRIVNPVSNSLAGKGTVIQ